MARDERRPGTGTPSSTDAEAGDGPYRRWSRRKSRARAPAAAAPTPPADAEPVPDARSPTPGAAPPPAPERVLGDADMPPLDSLDAASDYSPFLSAGVSEGLRRAALRKLFRSAVFNELDGLDDYCEDFTGFDPLGATVTAEMRHRMEVEAERAREAGERARASAEPAPAAPPPPDLAPPVEEAPAERPPAEGAPGPGATPETGPESA